MKMVFGFLPGIALCVILSVLAIVLAPYIPLGDVTLAILLGIALGNTIKRSAMIEKGIAYSEKHILSFAIALMGVNLNYLILKELGIQSILIIVAAIALTIASSVLLAKVFNFDKKFALLLGVGNGICGSSAIAATESIIGAQKNDVGLSVAIVNFLGTIGIFLLPFLATVVLEFDSISAGVLIGTTLQSVGQVAAAGFSVGTLAGQTSTIVKMVRILMLTPVVLMLIVFFPRSDRGASPGRMLNTFGIPHFVLGFVFFSLIPTFKLLPHEQIAILSNASHYALVVAMAGIGLNITVGSILRDGRSALLIGSILFALQIVLNGSMIIALLP